MRHELLLLSLPPPPPPPLLPPLAGTHCSTNPPCLLALHPTLCTLLSNHRRSAVQESTTRLARVSDCARSLSPTTDRLATRVRNQTVSALLLHSTRVVLSLRVALVTISLTVLSTSRRRSVCLCAVRSRHSRALRSGDTPRSCCAQRSEPARRGTVARAATAQRRGTGDTPAASSSRLGRECNDRTALTSRLHHCALCWLLSQLLRSLACCSCTALRCSLAQ